MQIKIRLPILLALADFWEINCKPKVYMQFVFHEGTQVLFKYAERFTSSLVLLGCLGTSHSAVSSWLTYIISCHQHFSVSSRSLINTWSSVSLSTAPQGTLLLTSFCAESLPFINTPLLPTCWLAFRPWQDFTAHSAVTKVVFCFVCFLNSLWCRTCNLHSGLLPCSLFS